MPARRPPKRPVARKTPALPKPQRRASVKDSEAVRELFAGLATRADVLEAAEAILINPAHPHWPRVWETCLERGYGKPKDPSADTAVPFVVFAAMPAAASSIESWQRAAAQQLSK